MLAYHFVRSDSRLNFKHGGERVQVEAGLVLEWASDPILCEQGLHASLTQEEAADCAREIGITNGVLTRVACSGRVKIGSNKFVCTRRAVVEIIGPNN